MSLEWFRKVKRAMELAIPKNRGEPRMIYPNVISAMGFFLKELAKIYP